MYCLAEQMSNFTVFHVLLFTVKSWKFTTGIIKFCSDEVHQFMIFLTLYVLQKKCYWVTFPQNVCLVKSVALCTTFHNTITKEISSYAQITNCVCCNYKSVCVCRYWTLNCLLLSENGTFLFLYRHLQLHPKNKNALMKIEVVVIFNYLNCLIFHLVQNFQVI